MTRLAWIGQGEPVQSSGLVAFDSVVVVRDGSDGAADEDGDETPSQSSQQLYVASSPLLSRPPIASLPVVLIALPRTVAF